MAHGVTVSGGLSADDRADLDDLVQRYAQLVDQQSFAAVGDLFAPDAVLVQPDPPTSLTPVREVVGRAAIVAALGVLESLDGTFHAVLGRIVTPAEAPNRATGRVSCAAHHLSTRNGETTDLTWHLHYDDRYVRLDGRWLIARRELTIEFITTAPVRAVRRA